MEFMQLLTTTGIAIALALILAFLVMVARMYNRVPQGKALIINTPWGTKVTFTGAIVLPIIHRSEIMDITVKRIQIQRDGSDGLICKDNMRADINVAFFLRVNKNADDVKSVADLLGVDRASDNNALIDHFDAKFSEALKTAGKKFDFVELYESRARFKKEVTDVIGSELDGYVLDDCAIDYLEQTPMSKLSPDNILDSQGIKKITELTATQKILANQIDREREKTIKQQNVDAEEAVLEMDRHLAESQERQRREIATVKAREGAEAHKIQQIERLKAEQARIQTEEELAVLEQNKERQIIVAEKNKERTAAIETERIHKDRLLEQTERERVVDLARIEKERALEVERKNIQDVIRERVTVEKTVVEEEEKIKDTRALAEASRTKNVALIEAEQHAEESRVKVVKHAMAEKESADQKAMQKVIEAEADQKAADKSAEARKVLAEAKAAEEASIGMAEVRVQLARAEARDREGTVEAGVKERLALAEAKGLEAHADARAKQGQVEITLLEGKAIAEAKGITVKAEANKQQGFAAAEARDREGTVEAGIKERLALAEAKGLEAHADARAKQGQVEANILEQQNIAEAKGISVKAEANKQQGFAEAEVLENKALATARGDEASSIALEKRGNAEAANMLKRFQADAQGMLEKAEAMKHMDEAGRNHEEFKLINEREVRLALAELDTRKDIASAQAIVLSEGLRSAKIDIVGGESLFFDKLMGAVTQGKSVDRLVGSSKVLSEVKDTFFNGDPEYFKSQLKGFIQLFGLNSEDLKNLTISAAIGKMMQTTGDDKTRGVLGSILNWAEKLGLSDTHLDQFKM